MVGGFVMITVDTEAQPQRASEDHVERLIYGRFGEEELGNIAVEGKANRLLLSHQNPKRAISL